MYKKIKIVNNDQVLNIFHEFLAKQAFFLLLGRFLYDMKPYFRLLFFISLLDIASMRIFDYTHRFSMMAYRLYSNFYLND